MLATFGRVENADVASYVSTDCRNNDSCPATAVQRELHSGEIPDFPEVDGRSLWRPSQLSAFRDALFFLQAAAGPNVAVWRRADPAIGWSGISQSFFRGNPA